MTDQTEQPQSGAPPPRGNIGVLLMFFLVPMLAIGGLYVHFQRHLGAVRSQWQGVDRRAAMSDLRKLIMVFLSVSPFVIGWHVAPPRTANWDPRRRTLGAIGLLRPSPGCRRGLGHPTRLVTDAKER